MKLVRLLFGYTSYVLTGKLQSDSIENLLGVNFTVLFLAVEAASSISNFWRDILLPATVFNNLFLYNFFLQCWTTQKCIQNLMQRQTCIHDSNEQPELSSVLLSLFSMLKAQNLKSMPSRAVTVST